MQLLYIHIHFLFRLMLFVRLLVVMGVFWILETATFISDDTTGIKTVADVSIGLQGVI